MEERWKQSYDLLSLGTFPDGFDKSQKLNLRRYASKFKLKVEYLKYMLVYNAFIEDSRGKVAYVDRPISSIK